MEEEGKEWVPNHRRKGGLKEERTIVSGCLKLFGSVDMDLTVLLCLGLARI